MSRLLVHQLYQRLETVGRGAYGSVHKGIHIPTGNVVALKIINLDTEDDDVEDIQREVSLLTQLRDAPNVTKYYGCYMDGPRVWIVMEFAQGGSVRTLMKACKDGIIEEKYIVIIVREVLMGLGYLHRSAIIHRDIKAANILITAVGKVMICDFGVSALLATTSSKRNTFIGTPYWMAPEVAQAVPAYDTKADIWSLGILIYEMAKGSPPHSNMEATKVLQLIPRSRPPRLIDGEGSKDMRDFVICCLKESPIDRLPPDELIKTKWIKSASKVPISVLKDLIIRYDTWCQGGGIRSSLADPLPWEDEVDSPPSPPAIEDDWEFDTVRGTNPSSDSSERLSLVRPTEDASLPQNLTIRPSGTSKVPSSLRLLFQDETSVMSDPFNPPATFPLQSTNNNSPPPIPPSSTPSRDRFALKRALVVDSSGDESQHTHRPGFVFPPRPSPARSANKIPVGETEFEYGKSHNSPSSDSREKLPPLGPGIPSGLGPSIDLGSSAKSQPTYREVGSSRGLADIEKPPAISGTVADIGIVVSEAPPSSLSSSSNPEPAILTKRSILNRKRSQSSVGDMGGRSLGSHEYRFPMKPLDLTTPPLSRINTGSNFVNDTGGGINRTISRKPSLIRQASVSVMESVSSTPLLPPVPPFLNSQRKRSGSGASGNSDHLMQNIPDLRDVLKVSHSTLEHQLGMVDLLPPSPSAFASSSRTYSPSRNSVASFSSQSVPGTTPSSPSRPDSPLLEIVQSSLNANVQADISGSRSYVSRIRPLDLGTLMSSREDTESELASTVEELVQWLSEVESGFTDLLVSPTVDMIEEEQEDSGSHIDGPGLPRNQSSDHPVVDESVSRPSASSQLAPQAVS